MARDEIDDVITAWVDTADMPTAGSQPRTGPRLANRPDLRHPGQDTIRRQHPALAEALDTLAARYRD